MISTNPRPQFLPPLLLWAGMAACLLGLVVHRMWEPLPFPRFFEHVLLALLALVAAWPLQHWLRLPRAAALALVWAAALAVLAGPMAVVAVAVLAAAALALGSLLLRGPVALPVGLALIAGIVGWLLPLPVHLRAAYALACVVLVVWRRAAVADACRAAWQAFDAAARASPRSATAAVLLVGLASTGAWLPTMQFDDVAYHLGLPWQLQDTARYAMDPMLQVWALAPWGGDVLHGVAQVLAGGEARGALGALWLAIAGAAVFAVAGSLGGDATRRWWAVALMASLPLSMSLTAGMQTELPAMALLPVLAWLVLGGGGSSSPRMLLAGAVLFGALCGLKTMHAAVGLPLLAWAAWRHRGCIPWRWLPLAAVACVAVGGSSYWYAWWLAGNPVLPLLNATFESPYFATSDFVDGRWRTGLNPLLPWQISFDTERYFESYDGGFGFVLVALAGVWLLALRDARTRAVAAVAGIGVLLPLLPMQYARYVHPALVLALPALVVAFPQVRGAAVAFWGLCALNLAFATNASWMMRSGAMKHAVQVAGADLPLLERFAPERAIAERLRNEDPQGTVLLFPSTGLALAELGQRGRNMLWYSPYWQAAGLRAEADPEGHAWASLLRENGIAHVLFKPETVTPAQHAGLRQAGAVRTAAVGSLELWRVPDPDRP
jgi:hypothetical protein